MSEAPPPPPRRRHWGRRAALIAGASVIVGGVVLALGPGAAWVVDHGADGRRVWRLGHVKIDGVSGGWLGDLRADRLSIADESGVWVEARNVALDWRPFSVLTGDIRIDTITADRLSVLRRPVLLEKRPPSNAEYDVLIGALNIAQIDVAQPVFGAEAQFTADLSLDLRGKSLEQLSLALRRLDSDADRALAEFRTGEDFTLNVDVQSAPGGILARAFGIEEQGLRLSARGDGDLDAGRGEFDGAIGVSQFTSGAFSWETQRWTLEASAQLGAFPALATTARRIGQSVTLTANGARQGAFTAHAETPFLAVSVDGAFDEDLELDGPARIVAETARLSDIAREAPLDLGAARFEGELTRDGSRTRVEGAFDAQSIAIIGRHARFTGPLSAQLTDARFELDADLRASDDVSPLFAEARLRTDLEYERGSRRFALSRTTLEGDALALDAQGWTNRGDGEFSGGWRVRKLETLDPNLSGEARGQWRALETSSDPNERIWTITLAGRGASVSGAPEIVPQLLGAAPQIDAMLRIENGGVTVAHARLDGAKLRAGATGRIVGGQADLRVEASARGPLDVGAARVAGVVDSTGRVTGRLARPTLQMQAQLTSIAVSGIEITQPQIDFTLAPNGNDYSGRAGVEGAVQGQPFTAESSIEIARGTVSLPDLEAQAGGLAVAGAARISDRGPDAQLALSGAIDGLAPGVSGQITGDLRLTPETIVLDAQLADARAGDLRIRAATLAAAGPYDAIAARFDLRGRLRQAPLTFAGAALLSAEDATSVRIEGEGELADVRVATRQPISLTWERGGMSAALDVALGDGAVVASWQERGRALSGSAEIEIAPLAPLAAIWGERATGTIGGTITTQSGGAGLSGAANIVLVDARVAGRQRTPLTAHIVADLDPSRLETSMEARTDGGLEARIEASAPVVTSAAPFRIALAPERRGQARWTISGPVEGLWSLARLPDQALEGPVNGAGELSFGAGTLTGDGFIEIRDGRFEDKVTGVKLENLQTRIAIGDEGVSIERFTATDSRGGQISATGGSANPEEGRIAVNIRDLRLVDRPDASARASGDLTLQWQGLQSSLDGSLQIIEAEIDVAARPEAGIPQLDVIEINRPDIEDETEEPANAPQRNHSTTINVAVTAPGRVFTRGRGVEAEWSLDLRLAGTAANPRVFGEARAIRGQLALSGQPFEITSGVIDFNGDPLDARIDLIAERTTPDLTARIQLTGTANDPEIAFTSDPGLPEDEILPQVLFGRSVEDLSAFEAAQLAASLAALSGQASFNIVDAARAAAGLDRFAVRQDEDGGLLVAGGVYLTRDVYVEVARTGLGQAATRVEWTIRPQLVLITSFLPNGDQRASVRWRQETD